MSIDKSLLTSFFISKSLQEVGFWKQTPFLYRKMDGEILPYPHNIMKEELIKETFYGAYDLGTIMKALPKYINVKGYGSDGLYLSLEFEYLERGKIGYKSSMGSLCFAEEFQSEDEMATAAGKLLLKILTNNIPGRRE